jgi:hypothetical protein
MSLITRYLHKTILNSNKIITRYYSKQVPVFLRIDDKKCISLDKIYEIKKLTNDSYEIYFDYGYCYKNHICSIGDTGFKDVKYLFESTSSEQQLS